MAQAEKPEVGPPTPSVREEDPSGLPDGAPDGLKEAAKGQEVDGKAESEALGFLLGATKPLLFDVPVKLDTPAGPKTLVFVIRQLDGKRILEIEKENRNGDGPFAELDDVACNAAMVAESCVAIVDTKTNEEVSPTSERFIGGAPGVAFAVETRFKYQSGLLDGVCGQIRSVSGYNPKRVEAANRSIREAVGSS